jgi:hypothetical protein
MVERGDGAKVGMDQTYRSTVLSWQQGDTIPPNAGRFDPDTYSHVLVDHSDKPQTRVYRKRWPGNSTGPRLPLGLLAG